MYYYKKIKDDSETITKLQELAVMYPTEGWDLYYGRIRTQGFKWNRKRVRRVYLLLGLNQRRKTRRRVPHPMKVYGKFIEVRRFKSGNKPFHIIF